MTLRLESARIARAIPGGGSDEWSGRDSWGHQGFLGEAMNAGAGSRRLLKHGCSISACMFPFIILSDLTDNEITNNCLEAKGAK